ncbi:MULTISPECIES: hypothetical protein [Haloterrigena]|uniref:DUF8142 domain-containing protein n=2 Tax=Haloterrigena TaxID=121871 RepID=M0C0M5_9EURY|nr:MULTISPECIES: hypothetical protein [Haloterrigena]ELZ16760.1 hypothetical protein C477_14143 [Haloterrigena salina JCM 13891]QRV14969.1 hypothetical protein JMJ58_18985 [Haloterrigena salifodinae]
MEPPVPTDDDRNRRRAALYVAPFLAIGVANLVLLLGWGLDPLWGFAILPPILAVSAIAWVAFAHGFDRQPQQVHDRRN